MALEPMYSTKVAAELIPMNYRTMMHYILEHPTDFPARYHHGLGQIGPAERMLTETECLKIRDVFINGNKNQSTRSSYRERRKQREQENQGIRDFFQVTKNA